MPNANSVPIKASKAGKKILLNTRADAVAKTNRSYHSTVVPITLAMATFFMLTLDSTGGVPVWTHAGLFMPFISKLSLGLSGLIY